MARRLLGADNAATVLNTQDTEEEPVTQVQWLVGSTQLEGEYHARTSSAFNTNPTVACLICMSVLRFCAGAIPIP